MTLAIYRYSKHVAFALMILAMSRFSHAEHIKVFLLAGQSNMDGRGASSDLPADLQTPQDDVWFYFDARNRFDQRSLERKKLLPLQPGSGADFGPEVTLGRSLADADSRASYALLKYATGGSSLVTDWNPSGGIDYQNFTATVSGGLAALENVGHTYQIEGMFWIHGARDMLLGRTGAQYEADLKAFISSMRGSYGNKMPFFISQRSNNQSSIGTQLVERLQAAQAAVADADHMSYLISNDGFSVKSDQAHFDALGQMQLGRALAQSYIDNIVVPEPTSIFMVQLLFICLLY